MVKFVYTDVARISIFRISRFEVRFQIDREVSHVEGDLDVNFFLSFGIGGPFFETDVRTLT